MTNKQEIDMNRTRYTRHRKIKHYNNYNTVKEFTSLIRPAPALRSNKCPQRTHQQNSTINTIVSIHRHIQVRANILTAADAFVLDAGHPASGEYNA